MGGGALETKPINSNWEQRQSVQKGNIGERQVREYLESKGYVCYRAVTEAAHSFDFFAIKDKRDAMIAEVKTKAVMNRRPETGFNEKHLFEYKHISDKHNLNVFIFFVDENMGEIYGNWLSELEKRRECYGITYPYTENFGGTRIRLYPIKAMRHISKLDIESAEILKKLSNRSYRYGDLPSDSSSTVERR